MALGGRADLGYTGDLAGSAAPVEEFIGCVPPSRSWRDHVLGSEPVLADVWPRGYRPTSIGGTCPQSGHLGELSSSLFTWISRSFCQKSSRPGTSSEAELGQRQMKRNGLRCWRVAARRS